MSQYVDAASVAPIRQDGTIKLHGPDAFAGMRRAGHLTASLLDTLGELVRPGISTNTLDAVAHDAIMAAGAVPANIGYLGYAHATCISINHVVCHGIPSGRVLHNGDILNIDLAAILDGWHGDSSRMYLVGDVSLKARRLVETAFECLMLGIEQARPGNHVGDIGHAIQRHAERNRFGVVRDFVGHGVGRVYHDTPEILHFGTPGTGEELRPGMMFTVEPMINLGRSGVKMLDDGWTVVTRDRSLSAQFEHSIGITETGCEIFTISPKGLHRPSCGGG